MASPTTPILTPRQAEELHKSLISYLTSQNLLATASALRTELSLPESAFDQSQTEKYQGLLEKKWTSVIRLQRKILELEATVASLKTDLLSSSLGSSLRPVQDPAGWLPRSPPRYTLEGHRLPITSVAFHPVFSSLASASEDTTVKVWDWELGELERTLKGHTKAVLDVDYGLKLLASCSSDMSIKLWDPLDGYKNIRTLQGHEHIVSSVRFVPGGSNMLVSASKDCSLKLWDVNTGYCVKTVTGHSDWVRAVSPSTDGRWLVSTGSDMSVRLWDLSGIGGGRGEVDCKGVMLGHENYNLCCVFAPAAAYPYLSKLAGQEKPPAATSAAEFMATGSRDKQIRLWDGRGNCIKVLTGHDNWVRGLVFHPGGKYLISVADDRTLRCWDLSQEGKCVQTLKGVYDGFVSCVRWAPNVIKDGLANGVNGQPSTPGKKADETAAAQIRCVIATGSVDGSEGKVRIFAG
ncbi:putative nuclear distribution protein pac-1b [Cladorrhinum samala]|uniref:Nuclear distribution protein PAC1 n=1 Tax=Cladorrhinum samala TaxID=585594 RepID=A0AAV9HWE9_9PEZI|nr:putative nuclear distribution protein pac-1b [Cladorrhinum samala]